MNLGLDDFNIGLKLLQAVFVDIHFAFQDILGPVLLIQDHVVFGLNVCNFIVESEKVIFKILELKDFLFEAFNLILLTGRTAETSKGAFSHISLHLRFMEL